MATTPLNPIDPQLLRPPEPLTPEQRQQPIPATQPWDDNYAYSIATADFQKMESFRTQNHDRRFKISDEMYLAWVRKRTWERTRIPRSSVGVWMLFSQVQALLPAVMGALFNDEHFFECDPRRSTTIEQAHAVRDLLRYQLSDLSDNDSFITLRELFIRTYEQALIYGNGIIEVGWLATQLQRLIYDRRQIQQRVLIPDPQTGIPVPVPTGQVQSMVQRRVENDIINKPIAQAVDIRDFYIDPNCGTYNVQDAGAAAKRCLQAVDWFEQWRKVEGFNVPSPAELVELARLKSTRTADQTKGQTEAFRTNSFSPTREYSDDPAKQRVELVSYWTKTRCVWFIPGYSKPIWNQPNPYGMIPFLDVFYTGVPGRFYGLSLADLVEGDQRLAEAILNARIDELNLIIHPPIVRKLGAKRASTENRIYPGAQWEAENPKEDFIKMEWPNVTQQAYIETDALERRVQKTTGVTDLAVLGTPTAGGNSANRTATGVGAQTQASSRRIQWQVENLEDRVAVPLLYIFHHLNKKFLDPGQPLDILGDDGKLIQLDPLDILNASVKFSMKMSSKMRSRSALQAGGLQMIMQSYLNPEVMQIASQQGMMLDFTEIDEMVSDTLGIPARSLWKPMQPGQQQAMMQASPAVQQMQAKMQMQTERLAAMSDQHESRNDTQLLNTLLGKLLDNPALREKMTGVAEPEEPEPAAGGGK